MVRSVGILLIDPRQAHEAAGEGVAALEAMPPVACVDRAPRV
ncbi:hypothetical protein WME73_18305 [Sorangium sp. So ce302]